MSPRKLVFSKDAGHEVSQNGIKTDPDKIYKEKSWVRLTTPEQPSQFLYFAGYYRRLLKVFPKLQKLLLELMPAPKKSSKGKKWL